MRMLMVIRPPVCLSTEPTNAGDQHQGQHPLPHTSSQLPSPPGKRGIHARPWRRFAAICSFSCF
uniref:Uncharacterized protein n=1 Tax=Pseudomonas phage PACT201 TaxID=3230130 RepID=A0AAU8GT96_9VIRU